VYLEKTCLEASSGFEPPAPIFEAQGPFVGPSGVILELSTDALDFGELERGCIKFSGEFGPELRAWQERCGKDQLVAELGEK
jgi:hypothetical protein